MGKLAFLSFALVVLCAIATQAEGSRMVCYFGSWAVYRQNNGKFDVEDIDPFLCSHIIYSFVGLSNDPGIKVLDTWNELSKSAFERFINLKKINPKLKTLLAIGGWNEGSVRYSQLLSTPANRAKFADDALSFVQKYGFDGLDLDWEYPGQRGGAYNDRNSFTELIKLLKQKFEPYGLLLTAAVPATESSFSVSYNVADLGKYLDFVNVMTYDIHGSGEPATGHNAPLFMAMEEAGTANQGFNVDASIKAWISHGVPAEKLVMGVPMYGRTFVLRSNTCVKPRCPSIGEGISGQWTATPGMLGYNELCPLEKTYTTYYDEEAQVPYMVNGQNWISYDDVKSVQAKVDYIKSMKLGGGMIWSIETDDFSGACGQGKFPLLTTLSKGVLSDDSNDNTLPPVEETPVEKPDETPVETPDETPVENPDETPVQPPESVPESNGPCTKVGYVRDPEDCHVFYWCSLLPSGAFTYSKFTCGNNLLFDTMRNVCNYPFSVAC